jgi:hypothetical protein
MDGPQERANGGESLDPDPAWLELLLGAVRSALASPGDHRLFRAGKLAGLFPQRSGPAAAAATWALRRGLLRISRRETRGKITIEWVQATPEAIAFVQQYDSPQALLREWKQLLELTASGVPAWLEQVRLQLDELTRLWQQRTAELLEQLRRLAQRLDAAWRRYELERPLVGQPVRQLIHWAADALDYLDRRLRTTSAPCLLPELFAALRPHHPQLDIPTFHDGLIRLEQLRLLRLLPYEPIDAPEFALLHHSQLLYAVER